MTPPCFNILTTDYNNFTLLPPIFKAFVFIISWLPGSKPLDSVHFSTVLVQGKSTCKEFQIVR